MKILYPFLFVLIASLSLNAQTAPKPCEDVMSYTSLEEALAEPEKVVYLDLAMHHPKLTSIPKEVGQFPNLVCLDVSFNRIASIPVEIKKCTKLKHLNLMGNRYLAKLPKILKEIPSLEVVNVSDIPEWSDATKEEAKALLPNVQVIVD